MGCASSVPGPDLVNDEATSKPSPRASRTSRSNQSSWSESTGKKQRKVLDDAESTSTAPAEAPTSVIPIGPAPPGDGRNLVLIAWDIENVRLPLNTAPGLSPRHIVRYLKKHFIYTPGRTEYRTVAAVTERSLNRIRRDHPAFVEHVVPDLTLLMASAVHAKRNADVMLKKELHHFTTEHAHLARAHPGQLTIVLISGDEDFLEPVQGALQAGFNVELLTHDTASGALMAQGYSRPPGLWSAFLRGCSGVQQLVLPYGDEQMHSVLGPRSLVLAGFGHRRGGELARAIAARMMRAAATATAAAAAAAMNGGGGGSGTAAAVATVSGGGGGSSMSPRGVTGNTNANSSSFSSGDAELVLVEPSFGDFSGTCCVVATPPPGLDAAALAAGLRQQAAAAAGPEPRLLVFEARRVLRLTLQADDAWVPASGGGGGSLVRHPNASGDDAAADGVDGIAVADADVEPAADAAADARAPTSFNAATSGRSLHDRMLDACERLAALLRIYRLPLPPGAAAVGGVSGGGGSPHQQHHQHHPHAYPSAQGVSRQLHVLCRFSRAPGPGELTCTVLCAAAAAAEAADLLHALSHLRGLASELMRHHGVALHAECMFAAAAAAAAAATVAASTAVPSPGATLVLAPAGPVEEAEGAEGPAVPAAVAGILPPPPPPPRRRLPALSFQPTTYRQAVAPQQQQQQHVAVAQADSAVGAETAATAHGEGLQGTQQCQPQQQPLPQQPQHANGHGLATHESSPAAPIPMVAVGGSGAPPVADGLSSSDEGEAGADGKKKKKKKKKRKKKKKHKKNSVVPAP